MDYNRLNLVIMEFIDKRKIMILIDFQTDSN